jgi:uncharacterized membrane protein YbhN (UPF0104 family)
MRHVVMAATSLAVLGVLCASPSLLGDRVRTAVDGLDAARPAWLWVAGIAFTATSACGALAWRAALRACGTPLSRGDAAARYCVGSGVNAIAPAHLGSAVRVALFGRVTHGGCWTVGGAAAAVGATRAVWIGVLVALGAAGGILPAWPLAALGGAVLAGGATATFSRRLRLPRRLEQVLAAFRELGRSPRDLAIVTGWALAGATAKVGASTAVVAALGVDRPLRLALVLVPAVELAAIMPITPGNVGVASAAVAFALHAQGVGADVGLSAGIVFGGVELLAAIGVGIEGGLALARTRVRPHLRLVAVATLYGTVALAFGTTVLLPAI